MYRECQKQFSVPGSQFSALSSQFLETPSAVQLVFLRTENRELLLSEILPVGTVRLGDSAYGLIPRNHPGNDQGKYQARGQDSHGRFAKIVPVQPEGKINFEREHTQKRNGRVNERDNRKNFAEAGSQVSPESGRASAQNAVGYGIADHLPKSRAESV